MILIDEDDEKYIEESGIELEDDTWKENKNFNNSKTKSQDLFHKPKAL